MTLALSGLPVTSRVPIAVCESVLSWKPSVNQGGPAYNDALQDLMLAQAKDLKVLALRFADVLFVSSIHGDMTKSELTRHVPSLYIKI